jgi:hypothetical protein
MFLRLEVLDSCFLALGACHFFKSKDRKKELLLFCCCPSVMFSHDVSKISATIFEKCRCTNLRTPMPTNTSRVRATRHVLFAVLFGVIPAVIKPDQFLLI